MAKKERFTFDEKMRNQIYTMSKYKLPHAKMAAILGITMIMFDRALKKDIAAREKLETGKAHADFEVSKTAYEMAIDKKNPAFTMFYLKTQMGWRETQRYELSGPDGQPIETKEVGKKHVSEEQQLTRIAMLNRMLELTQGQ